jgi:thiosulfate reductase cytochrome b subunit
MNPAPEQPAQPSSGRRTGLPRSTSSATSTTGSSGTDPLDLAKVGPVLNAGAPAARRGLPTRGADSVKAADAVHTFPAAVEEVSAPVATPGTGRSRVFARSKPLVVALGLIGAVCAFGLLVLLTRWLLSMPCMQDFITTFPGATEPPNGMPSGFPDWLRWQHFLNFFFLVLIIRSGILVRTTQRPQAYWTRTNTGPLRSKRPPQKISLELCVHLGLDILWLVNGVIFAVLLVASGQWMRIVPTSWDVFPNALSAALQYLSMAWPTENGWVNYNSLQILAYFVTVFIAAPLAAVTGVRMSNAWPKEATTLNKMYPIELARAVHFPVMLYFVLFVIVHVTLVFATGALRNLNHIYAGQDTEDWTGFWFFAASIVVMAGAVLAMRPVIVSAIASLFGKVGR